MTLTASDREFVALGASIGAGCHPCTQYHSQAALRAGLSPEQVLWAVEQARSVRATGGMAVANVGRRLVGAAQEELATQKQPGGRGCALVRIGAAAGCNSGVLLAEYSRQAVGLGVDGGELRQAVDIAEAVKTQAGKFLHRDAERVLGQAIEAASGVAASSGSCCAAEQASAAVEVRVGSAAGECDPACGCEEKD